MITPAPLDRRGAQKPRDDAPYRSKHQRFRLNLVIARRVKPDVAIHPIAPSLILRSVASQRVSKDEGE